MKLQPKPWNGNQKVIKTLRNLHLEHGMLEQCSDHYQLKNYTTNKTALHTCYVHVGDQLVRASNN